LSPVLVAALVALNLLVIFLLLAAPVGARTIVRTVLIAASREKLWSALWPLGEYSGWSGQVLSAEQVAGSPDRVRVSLSWEGRDGRPIEKVLRLSDVVEGRSFASLVEDDSSLDPVFWAHYSDETLLEESGEGTLVTLRRTDRYRGLAFLIFRYFATQRELTRLKEWGETGAVTRRFMFERPLTQVGFAVVSALILWPFFGLSLGGFILASVLTAVVALHELGHMAAFRMMGHRKVRMIFIPLLGGVAIGGRPYDSRFEVGFVALMGAGFSAFVVPIAIASSNFAEIAGHPAAASVIAALAGFAAFFNIANLVPVWKFDGGQVLRQICPEPVTLALASFAALSAFLALGRLTGLSPALLIGMGVVFAILSLLTASSGVKPRHELKPIRTIERITLGAAFAAIFAIHFCGVLWAHDRIAEAVPDGHVSGTDAPRCQARDWERPGTEATVGNLLSR
jgi:Zn-dependent protease